VVVYRHFDNLMYFAVHLPSLQLEKSDQVDVGSDVCQVKVWEEVLVSVISLWMSVINGPQGPYESGELGNDDC